MCRSFLPHVSIEADTHMLLCEPTLDKIQNSVPSTIFYCQIKVRMIQHRWQATAIIKPGGKTGKRVYCHGSSARNLYPTFANLRVPMKPHILMILSETRRARECCGVRGRGRVTGEISYEKSKCIFLHAYFSSVWFACVISCVFMWRRCTLLCYVVSRLNPSCIGVI